METVEQKVEKQLNEIKEGLQTTQKEQLSKAISEMTAALESKNNEAIQKAIKENIGTINDGLKELADWKKERGPVDEANQKALDELISNIKEINKNTKPNGGKILTLDEAISMKLKDKDIYEAICKVRKGHPFTLDMKDMGVIDMSLKAVGTMTVGASLTGDPVATYSARQALLPSQRINFRDIIPTVFSDTGLYVHYKESGGEGEVGEQTEGSAKDQLDFDFTEVKTVNKYVSGFTRYSKQLQKSLPFLQGTLPRLLLRKFYNEENDYFYDTIVAAATGTGTTTESDAVKALIDFIADQHTANYMSSVIIVDHNVWAKLNKRLYNTGNYQGSGGVMSFPDGSIRIAGIPVVPASWANAEKILILDNDYVERIEVESLRVEFFEQDSDNVQKNLITARIECYEEINLMLPASAIYADITDAS